MKYMFSVEFTIEAGNRYRDDRAMREELEALFDRCQPEALYVGLTRRVVFLTVDTEEPALLGDIHSTLARLAEAAPQCDPVVSAPDFVRISTALAERGRG